MEQVRYVQFLLPRRSQCFSSVFRMLSNSFLFRECTEWLQNFVRICWNVAIKSVSMFPLYDLNVLNVFLCQKCIECVLTLVRICLIPATSPFFMSLFKFSNVIILLSAKKIIHCVLKNVWICSVPATSRFPCFSSIFRCDQYVSVQATYTMRTGICSNLPG